LPRGADVLDNRVEERPQIVAVTSLALGGVPNLALV